MMARPDYIAEIIEKYGAIRLGAAKLFCLFLSNIGRVVTYDQIESEIWNDTAYRPTREAVKSRVRDVRKKLSELKNPPFRLTTCYGVGYIVTPLGDRHDAD